MTKIFKSKRSHHGREQAIFNDLTVHAADGCLLDGHLNAQIVIKKDKKKQENMKKQIFH